MTKSLTQNTVAVRCTSAEQEKRVRLGLRGDPSVKSRRKESCAGFPAHDPLKEPSDVDVCSARQLRVTATPAEATPFTTTCRALAPVSQEAGISNTASIFPVVHTPIFEKL